MMVGPDTCVWYDPHLDARKERSVFVVATANDVTGLPQELLRRSPFDEIFFLDLPNETERSAILDVHIRKRGRSTTHYNIPQLVQQTDYVGAEIEQAIIDAMYEGFADHREFTTDDILVVAHAWCRCRSRNVRISIRCVNGLKKVVPSQLVVKMS